MHRKLRNTLPLISFGTFRLVFFLLFAVSIVNQVNSQNTVSHGDWGSTYVWPEGNHPTYNLPGNPDVVVNHNVRVHQENLLLGRDNNGMLRINGSLYIETQLRVTRNNWEIVVGPGAELTVRGGVYFVQGGGGGSPSPDLIISGIARIAGGIHGTGEIRGEGTLIADAIGSGVSTSQFIQSGGTIIVSNDPLPIELLSFDAKVQKGSVLLMWETATETNNDFFTLDRSSNLINWETIGIVDGAGNSKLPLRYHFTDYYPLSGVSYYRLKQTDFDGKYEYFVPITIQHDLSRGELSFRVLKQADRWIIALPQGGPFQIEVFNMQGHKLINEVAENSFTIHAPPSPVVVRIFDGQTRQYSEVVN